MKRMTVLEALSQELNNRILWIILLIYTFIGGTYFDLTKDMNASIGEYIILLISNHYYLIYGFMFFFMFWSVRNIRNKSSLEIIRYVTYKKYYLNHLSKVYLKILLWLIGHVIIGIILGWINIGWKTGFSACEVQGFYSENAQMLLEFKRYFNSPLVAIISVLLFLSIGLLVIYTIIYVAYEIYGNKIAILVMLVVLANIFTGFKTTIDEGKMCFLFLNNYFILHHALFLNGKAAVFAILGIQFVLLWFLWRKLVCAR